MVVLTYLIEMILCSGLLTGIYWLCLRNQPFHRFNRAYLLVSFIISLFIPFVDVEAPAIASRYSYGVVTKIGAVVEPVSWLHAIDTFILGAIGLISFLLTALLVRSIWQFAKLRKRHQVIKMKGYNLVKTNLSEAPFSFLNDLFWHNNLSMESDEGKKIFRHEMTHIQQKHTYDILFSRLLCAIFWMNPFFRVMQKELVCVHEFLADQCAIEAGDGDGLAAMLLAGYQRHTNVTVHYFFNSSLVRRLDMVKNTRMSRYGSISRAVAMLLMIVTVSVLACTSKETLSPHHEAEGVSEEESGEMAFDLHLRDSSVSRPSLPDGSLGEIHVGPPDKSKSFHIEIKDGKAILQRDPAK